MQRRKQVQPGSSSDAPVVSQSEMQRLRRSRQLEKTQRLLDGHVEDFASSSSTGQIAIKEINREKRVVSRDRAIECESSRSGSSLKYDDTETHSVISKKHLGHIHKQYRERDSCDDVSNLNVMSFEHSDREDFPMSTVRKEGGERRIQSEHIILDAEKNSFPFMSENVGFSVGDRLIEGRGRGRGRGRSNTGSSGGTTSLGEFSQSSRFTFRHHSSTNDDMAASKSRMPQPSNGDEVASPPPNQSYLRCVTRKLFIM